MSWMEGVQSTVGRAAGGEGVVLGASELESAREKEVRGCLGRKTKRKR